MRYINIDLSSDNYLQQPQIFGGFAGEHNETVLQVKLPKRMIGIECSGYRFDFQTSEDNKISSPLIPVSELKDDTVSFRLIEQLTVEGRLFFTVVAILSDENTVSLISKTNKVTLNIDGAPTGAQVFIDPNGCKDELLKMVDARILEIAVDQVYDPESEYAQSGKAVAEALETTAGRKTAEGGEVFNDYENNKAIGEYSHAEGIESQSGAKAFTIVGVDKTNKTYTLDSVEGLEIGDIYSAHVLYTTGGSSQSENCGKITAINGNVVTVDNLWCEGEFATSDSYISGGYDGEKNTFRIISKPNIGTRVIADVSHAEGVSTKALSKGSHAEGKGTIAHGSWSHAEGNNTKAGYSSHAEGNNTTSSGFNSHAEGNNTTSSGFNSHAEGDTTKASGDSSHSEGYKTTASGYASHAEGQLTTAEGKYSHSEGNGATASGDSSHAEGNSHAEGTISHAEGKSTQSIGENSHSEGEYTIASGKSSHAEGHDAKASGESSHAEGINTNASTTASHAEGYNTKANTNSYCHAEGESTTASGRASHAEGCGTKASSDFSHAEGDHTTASGYCSHAEGYNTTASDKASHSEGDITTASGYASHAEGQETVASGDASHAEGYKTKALQYLAHVEGLNTEGSGAISHTEGAGTISKGMAQHVQGKYNIPDNTSADIVGNGTSDENRSNAYTLDWDGNAWYAGDVYVGSTSGTNKDEGSKKLATEEYVNTNHGNLLNGSSIGSTRTIGSIQESSSYRLGNYAMSEGYLTIASGDYSHAEGYYTKATAEAQTVVGRYNDESDALFVVGNGKADSQRSNAFEVLKNGSLKVNNIDYALGFAPAITNSFMGNAVFVSDVSPIEHDLDIKISSDAVENLIGISLNQFGKNLFPIGKDYWQFEIGDFTFDDEGVYGTRGDGASNFAMFSTKYPSGTYSFSAEFSYKGDASIGRSRILARCFDADGNIIASGLSNYNAFYKAFILPLDDVLTFTIPDTVAYWQLGWVPNAETVGATASMKLPQLEYGDTVTPYEQCVVHTATANAEGIVEGLKSISPNMTLIPDVDNVVIEVEYIADTKLYIDNKFKELKSELQALILEG